MQKSIIECLKEWLNQCPLMEQYRELNVDYIDDDADTFSIEEQPAEPVMERYLDGSSSCQFVFILASRFHYSDEAINNIENSGFYEALHDWLEEQSWNDNLPKLGDGKTATAIETMKSGYLYGIASDLYTARYQIQCRLFYDKEGF